MNTTIRLVAIVILLGAFAVPALPQTEMRMYYMVFLRRGPTWTATATPEATKVSQAHRANIERLTKEGLMVVAGPFEGTSGEPRHGCTPSA